MNASAGSGLTSAASRLAGASITVAATSEALAAGLERGAKYNTGDTYRQKEYSRAINDV